MVAPRGGGTTHLKKLSPPLPSRLRPQPYKKAERRGEEEREPEATGITTITPRIEAPQRGQAAAEGGRDRGRRRWTRALGGKPWIPSAMDLLPPPPRQQN